MTVEDPDRCYSLYQRRQVIEKLAEKFDCDLTAAAEKFKVMEFENVEGLTTIINSFDESPKKAEEA